ncbi:MULTISPECIES: NADPH-dependent FMN reductase [unclassified Cytobacillus]|uniref:NADPH-dependent FMN reductase n=1 Tax=unclassified Cytobacillus TaxID=2675268 RepID=UPI00135C21F8|nr:NADPH-dependent FMN reductase [Cytobacillus sp. AMY 15.2]KAF0817658.1 Azoreductase [Bacillus sp. ZZV12-4809]MCM3092191.1 NAD(P)H-dependent oxidoreductase [Cytobacillus sp. AMY 15.2]
MILVISGSSRKKSNNRGFAKYIFEQLEKKGENVAYFDLFENPLPIYSDDINLYKNENVEKLYNLAYDADGFYICTPEYHNGMSGALKNALDFLNKDQFIHKPIAISSAAGSGKGGVNALNNLRLVLRGLHGIVLPRQHISDKISFENNILVSGQCKESINQIIDDLILESNIRMAYS